VARIDRASERGAEADGNLDAFRVRQPLGTLDPAAHVGPVFSKRVAPVRVGRETRHVQLAERIRVVEGLVDAGRAHREGGERRGVSPALGRLQHGERVVELRVVVADGERTSSR
jgi:hypothetical protein